MVTNTSKMAAAAECFEDRRIHDKNEIKHSLKLSKTNNNLNVARTNKG